MSDAYGLLDTLIRYDRSHGDSPDYFDTIDSLVARGADQWASFGGGDPDDWWFVVRYGDTLTRIDWAGDCSDCAFTATGYDAADTVDGLMDELHQHRGVLPSDDAALILHAADHEAVVVDDGDGGSRTWVVRISGRVHRIRLTRFGDWELVQ